MKPSAETPREDISELNPTENNHHLERNVVSLGWVAFFGGMAQDMIQPILPTFYASVLGLNK